MSTNETDLRATRGFIITITKRKRRFGGRTQYGWRITGFNNRVIASGESYANLADLAATVALLTGVLLPRALPGTHHVTFTSAGHYEVNSRY